MSFDQKINEKILRLARAENLKIFVGFLVETMTPKSPFEIN